MGYLGIRTTGSIWGYDYERREYGNRVRRRDDRSEVLDGLLDYINEGDAGRGRRSATHRRRQRRNDRAVEWRYAYHLRLIARGRAVEGCGHPECKASADEALAQRAEHQQRVKERLASGELQLLLGDVRSVRR